MPASGKEPSVAETDIGKKVKISALAITAFLVIITAACFLYLRQTRKNAGDCVAEIYQEGNLLLTLPLDQVQEPYTLEIESSLGGMNRVEIRPGSIGVIWADCPDKLCVSQGFADSPTIPITCLPNRLVIRLRPASEASQEEAADAITF